VTPLTDCGLQPGDVIVLDEGAADRLKDCTIPEGVTFRFYYDEEIDIPMEPLATDPVPDVPATPEPPETTSPPPHEAADPASVVAPDAPFDLTAVADGDNTILLAIIAVVGGGAGFKLWQSMSAQYHERALKRLDIDAQQKGLGAGQPPPCKAATEAVEARLSSLEARTSANERASARLVAALDADEVDDLKKRLELLERKGRAAT
jgi:hypothetical protein